MNRTHARARTRARIVVGGLLGTTLALLASLAGAAHSPTPPIGWPLFDQNQALTFRWMAGEVPPAAMQAAIKAGATDASNTRKSRAPTLAYDAAGTSTVEYGNVVFCGVSGLACADATDAPASFRVAFRPHGWTFDWGVLRWCQMLAAPANGCFDAQNIALDEFGHVYGLAHHVNFADQSDYLDSVVQTVSRSRPAAGWNAHAFARCDTAQLQIKYDMLTWSDLYSTCLDLATTLTVTPSETWVPYGTSVSFSARLAVTDLDGYGRLGGNPVAKRTVTLQRRVPGTTTWSTVGTMSSSSTSGLYTLGFNVTQTYEYRAVFGAPATEGLRGSSSAATTVAVSSCRVAPCPQSGPVQ